MEDFLSTEQQEKLNYVQWHFGTPYELASDFTATFMMKYGIERILKEDSDKAVTNLKNKFLN